MLGKKCCIAGCNNEALPDRRMCKEHRLEKVRVYSHNRPTDARRIYECECLWCRKKFMGFRRDSKYCSEGCRKALRDSLNSNSAKLYKLTGLSGKDAFAHRVIAKKILGRELTSNETVHHVDLDPTNNALNNLVVLTRAQHTKLHAFLREQSARMTDAQDADRSSKMFSMVPKLTELWSSATGVELKKLSLK